MPVHIVDFGDLEDKIAEIEKYSRVVAAFAATESTAIVISAPAQRQPGGRETR